MVTKRYKNISIENIEHLLKLYPVKEFKSPYRSTIPLIELSENHDYFYVFF